MSIISLGVKESARGGSKNIVELGEYYSGLRSGRRHYIRIVDEQAPPVMEDYLTS